MSSETGTSGGSESFGSTTAPTPTSGTSTTGASTTGGGATSTTDAPATTTDPGSTSTTSGSSGTTEAWPVCGDGVVDPGEACDDGNDADDDGCLPDCTLGPGGALPPLDALVSRGERLTCLTALAEDGAHALVLGGKVRPLDLDAGLMRRVPLPAGAPAAWSHVEPPVLVYHRRVQHIATAADGDLVVAGLVDTSEHLESVGYLWLARVSPGGELVWTFDFDALPAARSDLALSPNGDIIVAATFVGLGYGSWVHAFSAEGALVWTREAPFGADWLGFYEAVAVAADSTIHAVVRKQPLQGDATRMLLHALAPDGQIELASEELASPIHEFVAPLEIVVTSGGDLVVSLRQRSGPDQDMPMWDLGLARFTAAAAPLGWTNLPAAGWSVEASALVAAPDDGVFVATFDWTGSDAGRRVVRYAVDGEPLWIHATEGAGTRDAALGTDGLLYVLAGDHVHPHLP